MSKILAISVLLFQIYCKQPTEISMPKIENGILDLEKQKWDFHKNGNVKLNGEWKVCWDEFILPEEFEAKLKDCSSTVLPSIWNGEKNKDGTARSGSGFASYLLRIKNPQIENFAINLLTISTAYSFYVNGKLETEVGKIAKTIQNSQPDYKSKIIFLDNSPNNTYDLLVHVSNYHHAKGGIWYPTIFGLSEEILKHKHKNLRIDYFLTGSIFIMAIYHIGLFFLRKKEPFALYFGLFCLLLSLRTILTGEYTFYELFPYINWFIAIRLEFMTATLGLLFFLLYIESLFKSEKIELIHKILVIISILGSLAHLVLPTTYLSNTQLLMSLVIFISILYFTYLMVQIIRFKRNGAKIFTLGFSLFAFCVINDLLYVNQLLDSTFIGHYGFFIFIFSQAFLLSSRFSIAFNTIESLSSELKKAKDILENKVMERTESLQKAIQAVTEANKLKDRFVSIVSHDIRAPLSSLSLTLEYLTKEDGSLQNNKEMLLFSKQNVERLLKMVSEILSYARLQSGRILPQYEKRNLKSAIIEIVDKVSITSKDKNITIYLEIPDHLELITDFKLLSIILMNILTNSLKFSHPGMSIRINILIDKNLLYIQVKDTGKGMSKAKLATIFDSNLNHSEEGTYGEKGSGFGLPFCYEMIQSLDGTIEVESDLSKGSIFSIVLPFYKRALLLVDDNFKQRNEWKAILKNFIFIEKDSGISALEQLMSLEVDIILVDYNMPGMDGLDFISRLRNRTPNLNTEIYLYYSKEELTPEELHKIETKKSILNFKCIQEKNSFTI
jgi:signal transduction histidine kinase